MQHKLLRSESLPMTKTGRSFFAVPPGTKASVNRPQAEIPNI